MRRWSGRLAGWVLAFLVLLFATQSTAQTDPQGLQEWTVRIDVAGAGPLAGWASFDPATGVMTLASEIPPGLAARSVPCAPTPAEQIRTSFYDIYGNVTGTFSADLPEITCGKARTITKLVDGKMQGFIIYETRNATVSDGRISVTIDGVDAVVGPLTPGFSSVRMEFDLRPSFDDTGRFEGSYFRTIMGTDGADNLTARAVWQRRDRAEIVDVFVLENQRGTDEFGKAYYPYPFGDLEQEEANPETGRRIFVVGRNLPERFGQVWRLESRDPRVALQFEAASAGSGNVGDIAIDFARGWKTYASRSGNPPDNLEAVILTAKLKDGVLPGPKGFILNGARALWSLDFGDAVGRIDFLREYGADPPGTVATERTGIAYINDAVRARLTLGNNFPVEQFELELGPQASVQIDLKRTGLGPASLRDPVVTLRRLVDDPRVYLSDLLYIVEFDDPGQTRPVGAEGTILRVKTPGRLLARLDDRRFRLNPSYGLLEVQTSPDEVGGSYIAALKQAARCAGIEGDVDWQRLSTRKAWEISNVILTEFGTSRVPVSFADHAAMLLLRDEFLRRMQAAYREYQAIAGNDALVVGLVRAINPSTIDRRNALYRMPVPDPEDLSQAMEFGDFLKFNDDLAPEQMLRPARIAIQRFLVAIENSARTARAIDDCDIDGLLNLTGIGFDAVVLGLEPKLMRNRFDGFSGRMVIEPDILGRAAVRGVATLARAVAAQRAYSRADTEFSIAIAAAALSGGASSLLGEGLLGLASTFAIDVAASTISGQAAWSDYYASQKELAFALGAAAVLGTDRLDLAELEAIDWYDQVLSTYLDALLVAGGAAADVVTAIDAIKSARGADLGGMITRGEKLARSLSEDGARRLTVEEAADLGAFLSNARAEALRKGLDNLGDTERRALTRADEIARTNILEQAAIDDIPASGSNRSMDFGDDLTQAGNGQPGEAADPFSAGTLAEPEDLRATRILEPPSETPEDLFETMVIDPVRDAPTLRGTPDEFAETLRGTPDEFAETLRGTPDEFAETLRGTPDELAETLRGTPEAPRDPLLDTFEFSEEELAIASGGASRRPPPEAGGDTFRRAPTERIPGEELADSVELAEAVRPDAPTVLLSPEEMDELRQAGSPTFRGTPEELAEIVRKNEPVAPPAALATGTSGPLPAAVAPGNAERARRLGFLTSDGRPVDLSLDEKLGEGGYNEVFALAGREDAVVRLSLKPAGGPDLDGIGRRLLEPLAGGGAPIDILRRIEDIPGVPGGFIESLPSPDPQYAGRTLEIVERAPEGAAKAQIARQGGMTAGQAVAFDEAMRWLNRNGLVWLDNHPGNYSFRSLGGDRWQVVVIDPGGIVPAVTSDIGDATVTAAFVQRALDAPSDDLKGFLNRIDINQRWQVKREVIQEEILPGRVDLEALDLPDASQMPFYATGSEPFAELSRLRALDDAAAAQARAELRARGGLIREVNPRTGAPLGEAAE